MVNEELRSRHIFSPLDNIDKAILDKKVNEYDVLFLKDENGKPYIGWIEKDGTKVIMNHPEAMTNNEALELSVELGLVTPIISTNNEIFTDKNGIIYTL